MQNLRSKIILVFILAGSVVACKKSKDPIFHQEYFGLQEGRYIIYDVTEIQHDKSSNQHDTLNYQIKTVWGEIYTDNEGREANKYYRYKRQNSSELWILKDVWSGIIENNKAELVEENQRMLKLVFAPTLSKEWNANVFNTYDEMNCYYRDIHSDTTFNGASFDSTLVVEQDEYFTLVDTIRKYEVYAKGVGLIYKHYRDLFYQSPFLEVEKGSEIFMTYNSSGFE